MSITGGCQCGAVRFRVDGELGEASICHCRMCQKATGGFFGPYVSVPKMEQLVWTRGKPKRFQSSNRVHRGFCGACGTPLTFEFEDKSVGLMIGAFDAPREIPLAEQLTPEWAVHDLAELAGLPVHEADEPRAAKHLASIVSFQHPDHDTAEWPPKG
jgi:hypothetical protein